MGKPGSSEPVVRGGYGPPAVGKGALPFLSAKPTDKNIVVVFKIASDNPAQTQVIATKIAAAIKDLRFGDYGIVPVLSSENIEMSVTDTELIAQRCLPTILRLLQVPDYTEKLSRV